MRNFKIHNQIFVAVIANFGAFLYGIALGWSTGVSCNFHKTSSTCFDATGYQFAWIVAFAPLGAAVSSIFIGVLRKILGTRLTVFLFAVPMVFGYIIIVYSISNAYMVMLGRFLVGMSAGCFVFLPILYIGEIASNEIRGFLLSIFLFMLYCGVLFVFAIGHYTNLVTLHVLSGVLPIFYATAFIFLPESPPMLVSKNYIEDAKACILFLRGSSYNVEAEIDDLKIRHQATQGKNFKQVFSVKSTRKALVLIVGLFGILQMSGITMIPYYSLIIFTEAGFENYAEFITIIVAATQAIGCLFALATIDSFGRKVLLIMSTSIMSLSLSGIATYFLFKELGFSVSKFILAPLILSIIYVIAFAIGLAPVTYVLLGEIFVQEAKVYVAPMSKFVNFMLSFMVALTFPMLTKAIGFSGTMYIYAFITILGTLFVVFFVPETKGASLAEIQSILAM